MDEQLICRILEEIENKTYKTGIEELNVKRDEYIKALETLESEEFLPKNCFAHAKDKPHILFSRDAKLTPKGAHFLRYYNKK